MVLAHGEVAVKAGEVVVQEKLTAVKGSVVALRWVGVAVEVAEVGVVRKEYMGPSNLILERARKNEFRFNFDGAILGTFFLAKLLFSPQAPSQGSSMQTMVW